MKPLAAFVASLFVATALVAQDASLRDGLLAPFPIRDQFLLSNGFLSFAPESARTLDEDTWSVSMNVADSNTFAKSNWISHSLQGRTNRANALQTLADTRFQSESTLFLVDGESHRSDLLLSRGFASGLELRVSMPLISTGGGWSDNVIENVHHAMKIGNAERESLTRNSETVFLRHDGMTYIRSRGNGVSVGDIAVSAKYELTPFEDHKLNLAVVSSVELPTGNARTLDGSGSLDGGLELVASRDYNHHTRITATLGVLRLGANKALGTNAQTLIADTVAIARAIGDSTAAVAQLTVSESPFRQLGIAEFSRRSYQLSTGVQKRVGGVIVHVAFIENVVNFENSADAGFAWGIARRF